MEEQKIPRPYPSDSIAMGKKYLKQNWEEGEQCPCCTQLVKLYKRKITSSMAYGLILMYRHFKETGETKIHVEKFFKSQDCPSSIRGDFSKLRHFELIAKNGEPGFYTLTNAGRKFIHGELSVPRYCKLFNGKVFGYSEESTTISKALGDKFNYKELMGHEIRSKNPKRHLTGAQQNLFYTA